MTVYNCGPIYYTICLFCLAFSLHCANLTIIQDYAFCTCFFMCGFNLKLPSCCYFSFFLLKCLPYFRGKCKHIQIKFLKFYHLHYMPTQYIWSILQMISESNLFVSFLMFAYDNYCLSTETMKLSKQSFEFKAT